MSLKRSLLSHLALTALFLGGCDGEEPPPPDTDDTDDDGGVIEDLDGTLAEATPLSVDLTGAPPDVPLDLLSGPEQINPPGDRDFFRINLERGRLYTLWADTGGNLRCDLVMRVYGPSATREFAIPAVEGGTGEMNDAIAFNDDMIYRARQSDPGLQFTPSRDGEHFIEVMEFGANNGGVGVGGSDCSYMLRGMVRSLTEVECNDLSTAIAFDGADLAESPARQPFHTSALVRSGEEFIGAIDFDDDDDVWMFRFGDLPGNPGGHFWLWSLWPMFPNTQDDPQRRHDLTLFDRDFNILAYTRDPVPDGALGFAEDAGIMYPVSSRAVYYLRVRERPFIDEPDPDDTDLPEDTDLFDTDLPEDTDLFDTDLPIDTDPVVDTDPPDDTDPIIDTDPPDDTDPIVDTDPIIDTDAADDTDPPLDTDAADDTDPTETDVPLDTDLARLMLPPSIPSPVQVVQVAGNSAGPLPIRHGWMPGDRGPGRTTLYVGSAHGYGNGLVTCTTSTGTQTEPWIEQEPNNTFNQARLLRFCRQGSSNLYTARMIGTFDPTQVQNRYVPPEDQPEPDEDDPRPIEWFQPCDDVDCGDREMFVIRQTSGAGGSIGGRRLTVSVQMASVGSLARGELFVFSSIDPGEVLVTSRQVIDYGPQFDLAAPDPVIQLVIPDAVQQVFIMLQSTDFYEDKERPQPNRWYLRAAIDPNPAIDED